MLNHLQQKVFNRVSDLDWKKVLRIQGMPGTGKSYVIGLALETLLLKNPDLNVAVVCPTWQALCNIKGKTPTSIRQKVTFKTIHGFLGQFPFNPSLGETVFSKGSLTKANEYDLIVIDEESMVNRGQSLLLLATRKETKILTMGDDCQLSAVMAKGHVFHQAPGVETLELTELVRNGGEIARVSKLCRSQVYYPEKSSDNLLVHPDQESLVTEFIKKAKTAKSVTDVIYLAFTNARVDEVSALVHKSLYGDKAYNVGQYLRMEQNTSIAYKGSNVKIIRIVNEDKEVCGLKAWEVLVANDHGDQATLTILDKEGEAFRLARMEQLLELCKEADPEMVGVYTQEYKGLETSFDAVANPLVLTINKSQGITVKYVFVDTKNVKSTRGGKKKELLCVGYSRASVELNTVAIEVPFHKTEEYLNVREEYKSVMNKVGRRTKLFFKIYNTMPEADLRQHSGRVLFLNGCKKFGIK